MLSFPSSLKIFLAVEPCDMRKGFNGLHALVAERLAEDPRLGALFVFTNARRNRLKMLYWDSTGLWVLSNMHDPQCAVIKDCKSSISLSSSLRQISGGLRRCWWAT